jgi:NAD(P)-dependent dehydrogenase (short-subunit alcohol dehydrogenase family)
MKQVIVVTGASSGFGSLEAPALADAGHTVYASMRETTGRNAARRCRDHQANSSIGGISPRKVQTALRIRRSGLGRTPS